MRTKLKGPWSKDSMTGEVAAFYHVTDQTIRNMIARGELEAYRLPNGWWMVTRASLNRYHRRLAKAAS